MNLKDAIDIFYGGNDFKPLMHKGKSFTVSCAEQGGFKVVTLLPRGEVYAFSGRSL